MVAKSAATHSSIMITKAPIQGETKSTLHDFISAHLPGVHNEESVEAFGKQLYHVVTQIVIGNEDWFSDERVRDLPAIMNDQFTLPNLWKWKLELDLWLDKLSEFEQIAFENAEFVWNN
jgi:hypothetical protein